MKEGRKAIWLAAWLVSCSAVFSQSAYVVVVNRDSSELTLVDVQSDAILSKIPLAAWSGPHMAMLTPDGKRLIATATTKNQVAIINMDSHNLEKIISAGRAPEHFDITPDGRLAYIGNIEEGSVSVVDIREGKEIKRISGFFEPHGFTATADGKKVYVGNFGAHQVSVIDTASQEVVSQIAVGEAPKLGSLNPDRFLSEIKGIANVTLSLDGKFGYAADGDSGEVGVIDTQTDKLVKTVRVGAEPWRAYPSSDGKTMWIPNNGDGTVSVIRVGSHRVAATLPAASGMTGVNFGSGKAYVISTEEGVGSLFVFDEKSFKSRGRIRLGQNMSLETASTTADGRKIYLASSRDNSLYVIDTQTDKVKRISGVGLGPWGTTMLGTYNYCH